MKNLLGFIETGFTNDNLIKIVTAQFSFLFMKNLKPISMNL